MKVAFSYSVVGLLLCSSLLVSDSAYAYGFKRAGTVELRATHEGIRRGYARPSRRRIAKDASTQMDGIRNSYQEYRRERLRLQQETTRSEAEVDSFVPGTNPDGEKIEPVEDRRVQRRRTRRAARQIVRNRFTRGATGAPQKAVRERRRSDHPCAALRSVRRSQCYSEYQRRVVREEVQDED